MIYTEFPIDDELPLEEQDPFAPPTAEELAAAEEHGRRVRARLKELHNLGATLTTEEKEFSHAVSLEEGYRERLEFDDSEDVLRGLGEALFAQGRFEEAAYYNPALKTECDAMIDAMHRDDEYRCNCIDNVFTDHLNRKQSHASEIVKKKVYSPRHKDFVYWIQCGCGYRNLTPHFPNPLQPLKS